MSEESVNFRVFFRLITESTADVSYPLAPLLVLASVVCTYVNWLSPRASSTLSKPLSSEATALYKQAYYGLPALAHAYKKSRLDCIRTYQ